MKKTFALSHPKLATDRLVDSIKHEVKKYIKRERNKSLPSTADYWDFDCKYGENAQSAQVVHMSELNKCIDNAVKAEMDSFYLEILVKEAVRGDGDEGQ
jgi:hypothetical protein